MHIACQCGKVLDVSHVFLIVENSLIEVADAPAERDVVVKQFGEFRSSLSCIGVTPGTEGNENLLFFIEGHIAVHHGRETDGSKSFYLTVILFHHILAEVGIAVLQTIPYSLSTIGPKSVNELVLPLVRPLCNWLVLLIDEDSLDAGRAKLYSENGLARFYCLLCIHNNLIYVLLHQ